jgi:hypothetical protein
VILAELEAAYRVAEASGNAAPMVQASLGRAKVAGLLVGRTENESLTATITSADHAGAIGKQLPNLGFSKSRPLLILLSLPQPSQLL